MSEETYALSRLDSAFDHAKSLLWPVRWGVWLRLAVVALFVGCGIDSLGNSNLPYAAGSLVLGSTMSVMASSIAAFVLVIALLWLLAGATMQFVFVDMLVTGDVRIRRSFGERVGKGARLLLLQGALALLPVLTATAFLFALIGAGRGGVPSFPFYVFIPVMLVVALLFRIVLLLTTDFVVPIMICEDCGVIRGWRRLIRMTSADSRQIAIYIVTRLVLGFIVGIVLAVLVILTLVVIAIPFVLIGTMLPGPFQAGNDISIISSLIPYLIIAIPVALLIAVPFITFFRYYALLVLEGLEPEYRLLPE
ncbi:hypothetical protein KH990_03280 [Methanoculleus bourgensis]|jgi:hypothetical protein|uniref:Uncharacterized protein n=1 Tax=Methanoculleus bourgensis TaxID=83986 RepID=A0A0X3BQA3_9EURY|nr:hypothetical protein [Methanoculleus bourgensis]MBT0732394.1 hypothetical protein [Methanoculleus bourgensis]MDD3373473.1 hypothetical protein [Methanoculleus bourgensis]CVK33675.1 conserved membrane protein of unknown function [Methanoculleus bourgensis]SAI88734.1 hypothetical protein MBBA_1884 [Methanoculleus bourgensis]